MDSSFSVSNGFCNSLTASYSLLNALFGSGQILGPLVGGFVVDQLGLMQGTALATPVLCVAILFALGYGIVQRHS